MKELFLAVVAALLLATGQRKLTAVQVFVTDLNRSESGPPVPVPRARPRTVPDNARPHEVSGLH